MPRHCLPHLAGAAITAMPLPWLNCVPGSGQARTTEVTGTECGARGATPALSEMGCFRPAERVQAAQQNDHHGREQNPAPAQVPHQSPSPGSSAGSGPQATCARPEK